ncbi:MAG: NAD(P)-binding domain-containing protein [Pseudonocardiaceae bacterium]
MPKKFEGATAAGSSAEAVADAECVVLMLFGPDSVRDVLAEVIAHAPRGALVIDSTTVGPAASREFAPVKVA